MKWLIEVAITVVWQSVRPFCLAVFLTFWFAFLAFFIVNYCIFLLNYVIRSQKFKSIFHLWTFLFNNQVFSVLDLACVALILLLLRMRGLFLSLECSLKDIFEFQFTNASWRCNIFFYNLPKIAWQCNPVTCHQNCSFRLICAAL